MRRSAILALALCLGACAHGGRRFPLAAPIWRDADATPFARRPAEIYTPPQWDRVDHTLFRPLSDALAYCLDTEARNVNALDEVPDSSWFTNRIGRRTITAAQLRAGACTSAADPPRPWTVVRAKTSGTSPGLVIRAADGQLSIFKIDFDAPERGTAADSISTRIFWGAGYFTPCDRVILFDRDAFVLATEADGDHPLPTRAEVDGLLDEAGRAPDGRLRGSLSEYIPGRPLGGWRFDGLRDDDPNDVFPHEDRREVRGMVVLSAWLNHIDSRAENNMDAWIEVGDGGYLRHYVLDAGDSFGQVFPSSLLLSQSFGLTNYVDLRHIAEDFLTLGVIDRPYFGARRGRAGDVLGYYDVERFDAEGWHNGYPNPAFDRATERDRAWMARIIASFTDEHLRAAIASGRFASLTTASELFRILRGRRRRILERYLVRLSPLTAPRVEGATLCLTDLALRVGLRFEDGRRYEARAWDDWPREGRRPATVSRGRSGEVCVALPSFEGASPAAPRYRVVDVVAQSIGHPPSAPARVHLYQLGPREFRVVGLERPDP